MRRSTAIVAGIAGLVLVPAVAQAQPVTLGSRLDVGALTFGVTRQVNRPVQPMMFGTAVSSKSVPPSSGLVLAPPTAQSSAALSAADCRMPILQADPAIDPKMPRPANPSVVFSARVVRGPACPK